MGEKISLTWRCGLPGSELSIEAGIFSVNWLSCASWISLFWELESSWVPGPKLVFLLPLWELRIEMHWCILPFASHPSIYRYTSQGNPPEPTHTGSLCRSHPGASAKADVPTPLLKVTKKRIHFDVYFCVKLWICTSYFKVHQALGGGGQSANFFPCRLWTPKCAWHSFSQQQKLKWHITVFRKPMKRVFWPKFSFGAKPYFFP